jgi:hypothetical protein
MKVVSTWAVSGARANYPMALDEANHRLFIGCRRPAKVLVFDTATGKEAGAFENRRRHRRSVLRRRTEAALRQRRRGIHRRLPEWRSQPLRPCRAHRHGGRCPNVLFVPDLNRFFLAVPHRGSQRAEIRVYDVH